MPQKFFSKKEPKKEVNSIGNNINSQPTQDPIDMLIRKLVPEKFRMNVCLLGNIISNHKNYYISYQYEASSKKYMLRIWYTHNEETFYHREIVLNESDICLFVNENFDDIVKLLERCVDLYKQKQLNGEMRHQICQEKLRQKVRKYCNQNL